MILVLTEQRQGEFNDVTFEMLAKATELADERDETVSALLLADESGESATELTAWADEVLVAAGSDFESFNADVAQQVVEDVVDERDPSVVAMGHTPQGLDLASPLAADLDSPLVTAVQDCWWEDGDLKTEREVYDGKINSQVGFEKSEPYLLTVQRAAFPAEEAPGRDGSVVELDADVDHSNVFKEVLEYVEPEAGDVDISRSDVLVSVGRGIEDEENIEIVEELADALGADVSGSRPIIDNDWLPSERQVGQSGKSVSPDLYLAVGISGASEHVIGMKESDTIVAINSDPNAPIFEVADFGIVDDLFDVVPSLTEEIEAMT